MPLRLTAIKALLFGAVATGAVLAAAPIAAADDCPAGFYPTDTSGVCSDMPPANRPPHIDTANLPAPIFNIVEGGQNAEIAQNFDSDKDGYNDAIDLRPSDPYWH